MSIIFSIFRKKSVTMQLTPAKINAFLFFKLPAAFWCGVRVQSISNQVCIATVTHRWVNQNPFNSLYFAVQAMAAELATGALMMNSIKKSGRKIAMLVASTKSVFLKKATGKITFTCQDGQLIDALINEAITTREGKTIWLKVIGTNAKSEIVAEMDFEWTVKLKS